MIREDIKTLWHVCACFEHKINRNVCVQSVQKKSSHIQKTILRTNEREKTQKRILWSFEHCHHGVIQTTYYSCMYMQPPTANSQPKHTHTRLYEPHLIQQTHEHTNTSQINTNINISARRTFTQVTNSNSKNDTTTTMAQDFNLFHTGPASCGGGSSGAESEHLVAQIVRILSRFARALEECTYRNSHKRNATETRTEIKSVTLRAFHIMRNRSCLFGCLVRNHIRNTRIREVSPGIKPIVFERVWTVYVRRVYAGIFAVYVNVFVASSSKAESHTHLPIHII